MSLRRLYVRLDDACHTMARRPWSRLENAFDELDMKPIVGVIPDCRDSKMALAEPDPEFWNVVRRWQMKGWTIALHGLHHVYHADPAGSRALVPMHHRSEFVGLDLAQQREIMAKAWKLFCAENVRPTMFMAPAHAFDVTTLEAIRLETPIRWITDGISFRAFSRHGCNWLPQQLGKMPSILPLGTWTLCLHPNSMTDAEVDAAITQLQKLRFPIAAFDELDFEPTAHGVLDQVFEQAYWAARRLRQLRRRKGLLEVA